MASVLSREQMEQRLVRYADLRPCLNAFIDTRTPGSNLKENFTIIGPGVAENPDQHVHIDIPHGFNIGAARQPPGCVNSQHSHETAEVFVVHGGTWKFCWGETGEDGSVVLRAGATISIPVHVFRGFENIGEETGFLFAVLGGDDPGRVLWAPYVFEAAGEHGLILLENGQLVDTTKGEQKPDGIAAVTPTSDEDVRRMRRMTLEEMRQCVVHAEEMGASERSVLAAHALGGTVEETAIIGDASKPEGLPAGKMAWSHGFHLRRLVLAPGARIPAHRRFEEEVMLAHEGSLHVDWDDGGLDLGQGDVLTIPKEMEREFRNEGNSSTVVYVVRGTDRPAAPEWVD